MSDPRKHHKVPATYLSGFSETGTEDGKLAIYDLSGRRFRNFAKPKEIAHQRDYYRLDVEEGKDPYALEKAFGSIEGEIRRIIQNVETAKSLPKDDDIGILISFVALQAARTDHIRHKLGTFESEIGTFLLEMIANDRKKFDAVIGKVTPEAESTDEDYERFRDFVDKGMKLEVTRNRHLENLVTVFDSISKLLAHRHWGVACAPVGHHFITSDNPVALTWENPNDWKQMGSPGFGLPGTMVLMTLNKNLALMGSLEKPLPPWLQVTPYIVSYINFEVVHYAQVEIYSPTDDFTWTNGNKIERASAL